jgi:biopolymer transport protein ExbB/TolQ
MVMPTSFRAPREWVLLLVSIVLVSLVCLGLHLALSTYLTEQVDPDGTVRVVDQDVFPGWKSRRLSGLLLGPEQIACYLCFTWALTIVIARLNEVRRQRRYFKYDVLPGQEGSRILTRDARPLIRKTDETVRRYGPSILTSMIRAALAKYALSRNASDVGEVVRTHADVEQGKLVTSMATVAYLVWVIPAIGFLGTVRGLGQTMSKAEYTEEDFLQEVARHLSIAFDCTFIALSLSVVLMYFVHVAQREEENLVIDCQQYCQANLLLRLYDPQPDLAIGSAPTNQNGRLQPTDDYSPLQERY